MSGKYGFGGGIDLPVTPSPKVRADLDYATLKDAITAGERLGFVAREPYQRRKPGPRRTEAQDKVSIPGPTRVIDAFRGFCTAGNLTLWQGLEQLLAVDEARRR